MPAARFQTSVDGGWNTEAGPSAPPRIVTRLPDETDVISVPWFTRMENCVFEADGWPHKMPGATRVNTTATGATDTVAGLFDYWRSTAAGAPVQRILVVSGTQIYEVSGSTLSSLGTGFQADRVWAFEAMGDLAILANDSTSDVPQRYNQTTLTALGGSPPNFSFMRQHRGRMWAAGVDSNKSRLYYSALDNVSDWTGAGSGSIDVDPDDGDVITGLESYKGRLVVFKGPYKGSIHYITGSSPTTSDAFARVPFVRKVGCTAHNSILSGRNDIFFWDDLGIHSLLATDAFGDYAEAFVSAPIASYFRERLAHNRFNAVVGAYLGSYPHALWTCSQAGNNTHNQIIGLDFRFTPFRFFTWPAYALASIAVIRDTNQRPTVWGGNYTGRAVRMYQAARSNEAGAYTGLWEWPFLSFSDAFLEKTAQRARIGYAPKGSSTFTFAWTRDTQTQQTASITQTGGALLGSSTDDFVLDTDVLSGGVYAQAYPDLSGTFKEVQIQCSQGTADADMEIHSLTLELVVAGEATAAVVG